MGPNGQKVVGRCPQVAPTGIFLYRRCLQPKDTVKLRMCHCKREKSAPILAESIWWVDPLGELTALS